MLCTLTELPWLVTGDSSVRGPRVQLGSVVGARTVKFLARLHASTRDTDTRDNWWTELREEVSFFRCTTADIPYESCSQFDSTRSP